MQATSMVLMKNAPLPGHVFKPTGTIFKLVRDIIGAHCFTNFHEDGTINVASRPGSVVDDDKPHLFSVMDSSSSSRRRSTSAVRDDSSSKCRDHFCTPSLSRSLLGMAKL
ncbi:hypothetical protein DPMN_120360 [Dreissena polymorpha]|uniref:Uncharacterized protein n=1 Tax=Dreissena polymorpha TaxID=45954 RepID=A0A9D4GN55_DREPO|nr:hypothetical protein DPMN_120360 [Dreissena polymorpha]